MNQTIYTTYIKEFGAFLTFKSKILLSKLLREMLTLLNQKILCLRC